MCERHVPRTDAHGTISIAARLNRLPPVRTHRIATFIAGIGTFFDLFDIFLAGILGTVLTEQFHLSRLSLPAVLASGFVGMFVGASVLGRFADRVGRRTAFLLNLGIYSAFTLLGAFSLDATMLVVSRFLAGIGIGAELPLVDTYLGELLPARVRGRYTAWAYTVGHLGVPAAGFLGRLLVPLHPFGVAGWRWVFVSGSLGAAIVWLLRAQLPESPRWLESVGRVAEAEAIIERIEGEARMQGPLAAPSASEIATKGRARLAVLLTFTSLTFLGYPIGSALSLPLVERIDRRWLIVGSAFLMSGLGLGLGYSTSSGTIIALGLLYTLVSNIFSNSMHIFQVEIFPTFVRATAAGTAYSLSRLSTAAMPFLLLPVLERWGAGPMFALVAGALWIVILDIALFAPSTTGRSLEQVNVGATS